MVPLKPWHSTTQATRSVPVQAPIADRFRTAIALANELVAGPSADIEERVRASQAVAGLADPVLLFRDLPAETLRPLILDGARALLGGPAADRPRGPARGRNGGRPAKLSADLVEQAKALHADGLAVPEIATRFGISRATVYRCLKI